MQSIQKTGGLEATKLYNKILPAIQCPGSKHMLEEGWQLQASMPPYKQRLTARTSRRKPKLSSPGFDVRAC